MAGTGTESTDGDVRKEGQDGDVRNEGPGGEGGRFNEFTYIYRNLSRHPARYVMTVAALVMCVVFFILVASLSLGLQEQLEGGLESDAPEVGAEVTDEESLEFRHPGLIEMEEEVKVNILNWLYVMGVMLFVTSGSAIATTMLINVKQRESEIGILVAVGFTEKEVRRIFVYETLWLCTAGFIIGLLIGATLSANVFNALYMEGAGGVFFAPARTPPVIIAAALVLTFATGVAATWYPARRASRMDPVRAMTRGAA